MKRSEKKTPFLRHGAVWSGFEKDVEASSLTGLPRLRPIELSLTEEKIGHWPASEIGKDPAPFPVTGMRKGKGQTSSFTSQTLPCHDFQSFLLATSYHSEVKLWVFITASLDTID